MFDTSSARPCPDPATAASGDDDSAQVAIVGGGIMGTGIAQVIASSGMGVTLVDVSTDALERALGRINRSLERRVDQQRLEPAEAAATIGRITVTTDLTSAGATADHAIETVIEELTAKRSVLAELDRSCREEVVIASNTSQFSITELASATGRADRVIGQHWFNPPPAMDLIELVRGAATSEETLRQTLALAERWGKHAVVCAKDAPGFITSRLIVTLALEAMRIVEEGIATVDDVNVACVKAFNHAMGPLDTIDFSGLDTTLHVADNMRAQYGERFLAPQNLRVLVGAGHLGRKTGRGFSTYRSSS